MKLPKGIKEKKPSIKTKTEGEKGLSYSIAFSYLEKHFKRFKKWSYAQKQKILLKMIKQIPKNPYKFYFLIRKQFKELMKELHFKCQRCVDSCCYFDSAEFFASEIGIYKEDILLLKKHNLDLEGYNRKASFPIYLFFRAISELDISYEKFNRIHQRIRKSSCFEASLKMIKEGDKIRCYYYDKDRQKCKIHPYKPLVCLTYPIRIKNNLERIGLMKAEDCSFIQSLLETESKKSLTKQFESYLSYWKYMFSALLYLYSIDRYDIKENRIINVARTTNKDIKEIIKKI
jgi:Fe-S-cluster containining protein